VRALGQIRRLQDIEVGGVFDVAVRVAGSKRKVDDKRVVQVGWAQLTEVFAVYLFVSPDTRKRKAAERRRSGDDLQLGEACVCIGHNQHRCAGAERASHAETDKSAAKATRRIAVLLR
jgi:hypothetical protein